MKNIKESIKEFYVRHRECYAVYDKKGKINLYNFLVTRGWNPEKMEFTYHLLYDDLESSQIFEDNIELSSYIYNNCEFIVEISIDEFLVNLDIDEYN